MLALWSIAAPSAAVLGVLLGALVTRDAQAGEPLPAVSERLALVEYSLQPPAAVFRSEESLHVVSVRRRVPGFPLRLVALTAQGAVLALSSSDGRELRVRVARGELIDPSKLLAGMSASDGSSLSPLEPSEAASDGR